MFIIWFKSDISNFRYNEFFNQSNEIKNLRLECTAVKIWKSGTVPYFCGDIPECEYPTHDALKIAIRNFDEKFLFVGLTEDFGNFMKILEKMIPGYFKDLYFNYEGKILLKILTLTKFSEISDFALSHTSTLNKDSREEPTSKTIEELQERMQFELKFYDHVNTTYHTLKKYYLENGNLPERWLKNNKKSQVYLPFGISSCLFISSIIS